MYQATSVSLVKPCKFQEIILQLACYSWTIFLLFYHHSLPAAFTYTLLVPLKSVVTEFCHIMWPRNTFQLPSMPAFLIRICCAPMPTYGNPFPIWLMITPFTPTLLIRTFLCIVLTNIQRDESREPPQVLSWLCTLLFYPKSRLCLAAPPEQPECHFTHNIALYYNNLPSTQTLCQQSLSTHVGICK